MSRPKKQRLKRRKDGRFACRYKDQWFYGNTEDEALEQREEYKRAERQQEYVRENPTLYQYALPWLKRAKVNVTDQTYREASVLLEKLTDILGDKYLRDIKPSDIKSVYSERFKDLSDSYIKAGAQLYRALFDAATEDGLCKSNPARQKSSKPHEGTKGGHRAITQQERQWIETLCTDHRAYPAVMTMLYAGIRPQEAKALNIDTAIDFDRDEIHLSDFAHLSGYNGYEITGKGKTDNAARTIPLFPPLKKALKGRSGMLVQSASGKAVTVQAWRSVWDSYIFSLETAINGCQERWYGRRKQDEGKKLPTFVHVTFTPYDLRHSFCTMCRDNNVELNTCIHWMGHADAKMILRIYDEYSPERGKKEAEKLNQKLFGSQDGSQEQKAED